MTGPGMLSASAPKLCVEASFPADLQRVNEKDNTILLFSRVMRTQLQQQT